MAYLVIVKSKSNPNFRVGLSCRNFEEAKYQKNRLINYLASSFLVSISCVQFDKPKDGKQE